MAYDFRTDPRLTVEQKQFLADHPTLAKLEPGSKAYRQFMVSHPGTAERFRATVVLNGQKVSGTGTPPASTAAEAAANAAASGGGGDSGGGATATDPRAERAAGGAGARTIINAALNEYGLGGLADWAWDAYLNGTSETQILQIDLQKHPLYADRFPGMAALRERGQAISESTYIGLEEGYREQMRAYGLPATFYDDNADFGKLIANRVSTQEFGDRLAMAEQVAMTDPRGQQLRDELARFYGIPNAQGAATAYFIDPDRAATIIKQQYQAAVSGAASQRAGFGSLTQAEAERVAGSGVAEGQQQQTFASLATMDELQVNLPGMGDDAVSRQELLAAGFEGNADAQQKLERTARRRVAQFEGGGSYAGSGRGLTGLGSASS